MKLLGFVLLVTSVFAINPVGAAIPTQQQWITSGTSSTSTNIFTIYIDRTATLTTCDINQCDPDVSIKLTTTNCLNADILSNKCLLSTDSGTVDETAFPSLAATNPGHAPYLTTITKFADGAMLLLITYPHGIIYEQYFPASSQQ